MKKVTLAFPTHDSLWSFKELSRGINVAITPARNTITGLFSPEEVSIAMSQFQAIEASGRATAINNSEKEVRINKPVSVKSGLLQILYATFHPAYRFYRALF